MREWGRKKPGPLQNRQQAYFKRPKAGIWASEEFRGISTFSSRRDRPGAWVWGRFGSKKEDMEPQNPLQTAATGSFLGNPGPTAGRGNLRPRKNFAGFRRFPRAETALEPGCGAGLEAKRRIWNPKTRCKRLQRVPFWETPDRLPEGGIYVLGRISRYFDVFLRPGPWDNLDPGAGF